MLSYFQHTLLSHSAYLLHPLPTYFNLSFPFLFFPSMGWRLTSRKMLIKRCHQMTHNYKECGSAQNNIVWVHLNRSCTGANCSQVEQNKLPLPSGGVEKTRKVCVCMLACMCVLIIVSLLCYGYWDVMLVFQVQGKLNKCAVGKCSNSEVKPHQSQWDLQYVISTHSITMHRSCWAELRFCTS